MEAKRPRSQIDHPDIQEVESDKKKLRLTDDHEIEELVQEVYEKVISSPVLTKELTDLCLYVANVINNRFYG